MADNMAFNESISAEDMEALIGHIRDVPDYPKKGILFKDITPLLKSPEAFKSCVDSLAHMVSGVDFDYVLGVESRGFILGSALAYKIGKGFVPARKKGKLPYKTISQEYALEYGTATLEMHIDAVEKGSRVLIVDDLLATGGTAKATAQLVEKLGATVVGIAFVIELGFLEGRSKLTPYEVCSLIKY